MEEKQREAQRQKEDVDMQSYPETIEVIHRCSCCIVSFTPWPHTGSPFAPFTLCDQRLNTILNERNAECDSLKTQLQELDRHTSDLVRAMGMPRGKHDWLFCF